MRRLKFHISILSALLILGCSVGKHKNKVSNAASSLDYETSAISTLAYSNYECARASYRVIVSSPTVFQSYNSSTKYYVAKVYSNGTVNVRFEDSNGNGLELMESANSMTKTTNNTLLTSWKTTRVYDSTTGKNYALTVATSTANLNSLTTLDNNALFSGTIRTGVVVSGAKVDTINHVSDPLLTWLPYSGTLTSANLSVTFSTGTPKGTGTAVAGGSTMSIDVYEGYSNDFSYSIQLESAAPGAALSPMSRLGYE